jgi:hypothetical protein
MAKINYSEFWWRGQNSENEGKVREVKTNVDPEFVHEALLSTFKKWIEFAMGVRKLGGRKLKNPSGKMASALRADMDKEGNVVALYIDSEAAEQHKNKFVNLSADSNQFVMGGHKRIYLKKTMLQAGKPGVRRSKKGGYLYRYVPIATKPSKPMQLFSESNIKNLLVTRKTPRGMEMSVNQNVMKMWLKNYANAHSGPRKIRTMSNKPGSAKWEIPAMKPFNVSKLLKDMVPSQSKGRVII